MTVLKASIDEASKKIGIIAEAVNEGKVELTILINSKIEQEGLAQRCEGFTDFNNNPDAKAVLTIYAQKDQKGNVGSLVITDGFDDKE